MCNISLFHGGMGMGVCLLSIFFMFFHVFCLGQGT